MYQQKFNKTIDSDVKVMSKSLGTMGIGGILGKVWSNTPLFGNGGNKCRVMSKKLNQFID